ncbi:TniQ family protein [Methylobacterium sp. E-016]|uniref:TniQ family protein n=1 Tax=Methylobacterium sp. E-016 TaxID=2836556 RepID=UPI001FB9DB96|nr:TniQ family protein [Methylobacterium sp. E-016]MCJ2075555.1 TniQ family protein [Methylobacterium sp. E-016]
MSGILSLTCSLRPGESATSFVSRLAARNHVASATDFSLDMGLTFQAVVDGDPSALDKIARLSGMPASDLERGSIRKIGTRYQLGGERLSKANLRRSRLCACPVCLRDDLNAAIHGGEPTPYGRTEWLLAVMRACPIHACALVEVAAAPDGAPRSAHDFTLLLREQLPDLDRLIDCVPPRKPSSLEGYVRGRLQGAMGRAPWLDRMELHAAITTSEMLGVLVTVGPAARLRALGEEDWHAAGDVGHTLAREGESAIKRVLSEVQQASV